MQTGFKLTLAGAAVLALGCATSAQAQEGGCTSPTGCLTSVLGGVVDGFTGAAGGDLWGWMIGGGQSAGTDAISDDLTQIRNTLTDIDNELQTIAQELGELPCDFSTTVIQADAATAIDTWYGQYTDYLTDMADGTSISVSTLQSWANDVINGTASDQSALSAMTQLHDLATAGAGNAGSIANCVSAAGTGSLYETNGIDDRPYYNTNVLPIQSWFLTYNTRAMVLLAEAYHINEWVAQGQPESSTAADVPATICPQTGTPTFNCAQPSSIYQNQLVVFSKNELQAGGAPYSTDEYLMVNGQDYLIARSIEQYNAAADPDNTAGCSTTEPGGLTSAPGDVCGATTGIYNDPFTSVAYGPYRYGASGYGTWTAAPNVGTFGTTLQVEYNQSSTPAATFVPNYLCTMTLTSGAGDMTTCTQAPSGTGALANGGAGLFYGQKIVVFPNLATNEWTLTTLDNPEQVLFLDAGIERGNNEQPNTAGDWYLLQQSDCDGNSQNALWLTPHWAGGKIDPAWYFALLCGGGIWEQAPGYEPSATWPQYRWPALDWTELPCSNGDAPDDASNHNPAGVPSLCGDDFDTWFETMVPVVPSPAVFTPRGIIAGTNNGDSCWPAQTLTVLAIGDYSLEWQADGNLVLYQGPNAVWATSTNVYTDQQLCWGLDGNLVIYAGSEAVWASDTADAEHGGNVGQFLELHQDGTLDIVDANGTVLWYGYRPTPQTTTADATVSTGDPNGNDGTNTQLGLAGPQPALAATQLALAGPPARPDRRRAIVAFDPAKIDAFLAAGPLASARLRLSSADQSGSGGGHWVERHGQRGLRSGQHVAIMGQRRHQRDRQRPKRALGDDAAP